MRSSLQRNGFRCLTQPRIPVRNSFLKPDLIAWDSRRVIVMDPIICCDRVKLSEREAEKVTYYNHVEVLEYAREVSSREWPGEKEVKKVMRLAINNRGVVRPSTVNALRSLGVGARYLNFMRVASLVAIWRMIKAYGHATSHRQRPQR